MRGYNRAMNTVQVRVLVLALAVGLLSACADDEGGDGMLTTQQPAVTGTPTLAKPLPEAEFISVSAGEDHTCGVKGDGTVVCWGDNDYDQADPPAGKFTSVSSGEYYSCGVKTDGYVVCWGANWNDQADPPAGEFVSVSAGDSHTCGVRAEGAVACWGDNERWPSRSARGRVRLGQCGE